MYREKIKELEEWKDSKDRMPLIIRGARQVGKTWIMKEFGKNNYKKVAYVNFDGNTRKKKRYNLVSLRSWDSRIRTCTYWNQNPGPYHLAISQRYSVVSAVITASTITNYTRKESILQYLIIYIFLCFLSYYFVYIAYYMKPL